MYPWIDRNGRLSWFRLAVFLLLVTPALWLVVRWQFNLLGPKPVTEAIHVTGDWAIRILLIALAITPLRFVAREARLVGVRRMTGVAAAAYTFLHLALYIIDQKFDLATVASEIVLRVYLTIGFVALLGLAALGATSTDAMVRRLGATRWSRLHSLVYPISVLALIHFYIQSKLNVYEPVLLTGIFLLLMFFRALRRMGWPIGPLGLTAIGLLAAGLTSGVEALWYWQMRGVDPVRVLSSLLDFDYEIRPAWWVLLIAATLPVVALLRGQQERRPGGPRSVRATSANDA